MHNYIKVLIKSIKMAIFTTYRQFFDNTIKILSLIFCCLCLTIKVYAVEYHPLMDITETASNYIVKQIPAEYQIQSQKLNIKNRVHFAGRVSSDDLSDYYRAANLHILPSIDRSEAFGLVTLEAAASGLSSIVSDLPGVRTLVEHKKSGIIVDPRDKNSLVLAITWALNNKEKLNEMGKFARTRVLENYPNSVCIERLRQAYKAAKVEGAFL